MDYWVWIQRFIPDTGHSDELSISIYRRLYTQLFLGLNEFGGIRNNEEFKFNTVEYGALIQYLFGSFSYGLGYKNSKINNADYNLAIINYEIDERIVDNYGSIGLRATYLKGSFTVGTEIWFGAKSLSSSDHNIFGGIYETHCRLMIGYFVI